jgi:hypothetical protein
MERAVKDEPCAGTLSPAPARHYLARAADVHYAMRPAQEGDVEQR